MQTYGLEKFVNPEENINIIYMSKNRICDVHTHEFAELVFIENGKCEHCIDGVKYDVEAGDLLFVNYGQTHSFVAKTEDYHYYNLLYVPQFFSEELINSENIYEIFEISMFREFAETQTQALQIASFRGKEFLEIKKLVEDMRTEFEEKAVGYRAILNGYSRVLFSKMLRKLKAVEVDVETEKCINRITAECMAYIDSRCYEKISLKEIAEHSFYNPTYFSRIFKEHCGRSLSEYIKEKRIGEAARLLKDSELSNDEIMLKVGYADKKQFYKNFRDIYGETPAQYRKKYTTEK